MKSSGGHSSNTALRVYVVIAGLDETGVSGHKGKYFVRVEDAESKDIKSHVGLESVEDCIQEAVGMLQAFMAPALQAKSNLRLPTEAEAKASEAIPYKFTHKYTENHTYSGQGCAMCGRSREQHMDV
jgi:hypothetical protein